MKKITLNNSYAHQWKCNDIEQALRNGKIPIEDFLDKGVYFANPYKDRTVRKHILTLIENRGYTVTGEFWGADFERYSGRDSNWGLSLEKSQPSICTKS